MRTCLACGRSAADASRFCSECGAPIPDPDAQTVYTPGGTRVGPAAPTGSLAGGPGSGSRPISDAPLQGCFAPGALLGGRYRIVGLLGRGGMGEVYRAEDLTLGQAVALKFLPPGLAIDPERQSRFRAEVRAARQVSHPNVCRVYDIGEADGHQFLSMEFIDGEDLASLLRRIGRLAPDKAVEMARQLCAGLAAAHEKGVLHRDLKPANVMIDGQGRVRLADFGLAGLAADGPGDLAGTPAYMAPEQFDRAPATARSDVYALGLVLYEMFTGQPAFRGDSVSALADQHRRGSPASISRLLTDVDPAIDRVIQHCLAKDPALRPASALAVSAALPGGDPLAAALAAGETPSPAMVAAAGGVGALRPTPALGLLAVVAAGLVASALLSTRGQAASYVPLDRSPEVLADEARQIINRLGYADTPADEVGGLTRTDYIQYIETTDPSPDRWENLRHAQPPAVTFWFRQSPGPLVADGLLVAGQPNLRQPPPGPGTVSAMLDLRGRLHFLSVEPPRLPHEGAPPPAPDWTPLLREAGFDPAQLTEVAPRWPPPVYAEARAAWNSVYPDRPDVAVHIEAAATRGRPVYFQIFEPWSEETLAPQGPPRITAATVLGFLVPALLLTGAVLLARRNVRLERGDQAGAFRLALTLCGLHVAAGVLQMHHTWNPGATIFTLGLLLARGLLLAAGVYTVYVALEPDVRRRWPETLIAWNRLLGGRLRDPLVGRDVLAGAAIGVSVQVLRLLGRISPAWVGEAPGVAFPAGGFDGYVTGTIGVILSDVGTSVLIATSLLLAFFLLFLLVRRRGVAAILFVAIFLVATAVGEGWRLPLVFSALGAALVALTVTRLGLLALIVAILVTSLLNGIPIAAAPATWYAPSAYLVLAGVLAVALFGVRTALADRRLFAGVLD